VRRDFITALTWVRLAQLQRKGPLPITEGDDLMLEPWPRTVAVASSLRSPANDWDAMERAVALRKRLAAEGKWPLVEPVPPVAARP
jgi:hypothetical protein